MYAHDRWSQYWEGELKRDNENIGSVTTQSLMWAGTYGITDKINLIAMLPYVKTSADAGTMHHMEGLQDLSLGLKYNFYTNAADAGTFKAFGVLAVSTPLGNYSPDYFPLSLGTATTNLSWRLTANYKLAGGFYANLSGDYTWRSNTTLDRDAYYTDGQMYMTSEVRMPNTMGYLAHLGYLRGNLQTELIYMQQNTLGGADIRRQDMPFVSNRMNASRVGALVMYYMPWHKNLALRASAQYTVAGRNVGQATTLMGGLMYTFNFSKNQ